MRRIQLLPQSSRPREKILKSGAEALTVEELLAVILITGNKKNSVSKLAGKIAKVFNSSRVTKEALTYLELGPSKIAQVLAVVELGKRFNDSKIVSLTSAEQVFAHCFEITAQQKESLLCFYLNARGELTKKEVIAMGSLNRVNLLPKEIFSLIKELPVAAIILAHNHPSGNLNPSDEDIIFTKRIKAAGDILGIKLLDHLIVSQTGWKKIKFK